MPDRFTESLSIAAAEQETGLPKDVLRAWERRYGFPVPLRDANGDRIYPADQIRRLRLLRILTDLGQRPGKLARLDEADLAARIAALRAQDCSADQPAGHPAVIAECLALVASDAAPELEERFNAEVLRVGLERFASDVAAPLCVETGLAWERGEIGVYQEHVFSQVLARCLRQSIDRLTRASSARTSPAHARVLLTTVPGEIHELGLLMVQATLAVHGAACLNLGPQTPLHDVIDAARKYDCTVVALSFSSWFDARRAATALAELRDKLPESVDLWAGGANAALRRPLPQGIRVFTRLDGIARALAGAREAER